MSNRIMCRIDNKDTLVLFPENGTVGESQGLINNKFDAYNAETNKIEDFPYKDMLITKVKTEGKLIFKGSLARIFAYNRFREIDLSGFDTSNVTDISYMFAFSQTRKLVLTGFSISDKTDTSDMFRSTPNANVLVNKEIAQFI